MKKEKESNKNAFFDIKKPYLGMMFKILIIILAIAGIIDSMFNGSFMSGKTFLFFTIQSNITIAVMAAIFLVFDIISIAKKKVYKIPKWLYILKFAFTVAICLTFLVYWTMLMPGALKNNPSYLYSLSNLTCHTFVPIFAILDWLFYTKNYVSKKPEFIYGIAMPLYYLAFSLICSFSGVTFNKEGSKVPYFFLDYEKNSWFGLGNGKFGVLYWIIIVLVMVLFLSMFLMWIKNRLNRRFNKIDVNKVQNKK